MTAKRPRAFVRVAGPDAADYLQRMVSNDVEALAPGESCEALLLTAKARVIAPLRVLRRADDDFLLLTEPELGERVRVELVRMRFAAKAEVELEEHTSMLVFGERPHGRARRTPTTAARRGRCSTQTSAASRSRRGARAAAHRGRHAPLRRRDRRPRASCRGGPRPSVRSRSRRAATRARSRSRASTTAASSTGGCACSTSRARSTPDAEIRLGEKAVGRVTSVVARPRARVRPHRGAGRRRPRDRRRKSAATLGTSRP